MSGGHTPGPWNAWYEGRTVCVLNSRWNHDKPVVGWTGFEACNRRLSERIANARLIAAAPEMLSELEVRASDLFMLQRAIEEGDPKAELLVRVSDMLRETNAVIAKARGES